MMDVAPRDSGIYVFGPFRLDPVRRIVSRSGDSIRLQPRLFDLLLYLVQNHGRLIERDELLQALWQGRAVEESNLGQAISSLRKILQDGEAAEPCIVTAPGRGYRFAMSVQFESPIAAGAAAAGAVLAHGNTPVWRRAKWLAAAVAGAALLWIALRPAAKSPAEAAAFVPPPHSVAVLAFRNLNGQPDDSYFSDGLSEDLIDSLGRVPSLHVAARLSAFSFKGKPTLVAEIARQLNVGAVLEGSVRREGERLRITANLVDARTGYQVWAESFDRGRGDVLTVQRDIAEAVSAAVRGPLLGPLQPAEAARLSLGGTGNPAAFDAYLRGMQQLRGGGAASFRAAAAEFDQAIALDPTYAMAHVQRALALVTIPDAEDNPDLAWAHGMKDAALEQARRAVALAPALAAAHAALAFILEQDRFDFAQAQTEYARALALAPADADVNRLYAAAQIRLGHDAAGLAAARLAAQRDPLVASSYFVLAGSLSDTRHYQQAWAALHQAEQLQPATSSDAVHQRAELQLLQHDAAAAARTCADERDWPAHECLAIAYHALHRQPEAAAQFAQLHAQQGDSCALQYAEIYAQWGDTGSAMQWLATAYRLHDPGLINLKIDALLDPIRGTPQYRDIERQLNFPA